MPIRKADQDRLDNLYQEHKAAFAGRREDYFATLYLNRKFGAEIGEVGHQIAFGGNDYGLDAYWVDPRSRNLYLYQFKWTEDHTQFKGSIERLTTNGLTRIFAPKDQDPLQNDLLQYLRKDLREYRHLIEAVHVHFVFKGDVETALKSEVLQFRQEELENKAYLIHQYFENPDITLQVDFIADRPGKQGPAPPQTYRLSLEAAAEATHLDHGMRVGFVPLAQVCGIYKALGQRFFDRNIRAALSPDNAPNRKIREALDKIVLKRSEEPSVFAFMHNGITIAAEKVDARNNEVVLHTPRLLNGAQTVATTARFVEQNADNPLLKQGKSVLDSIMVLAKIIEANPHSEFVTQVTIANNQQNPVHPWALRAMDGRQVAFADMFVDQVGIFYSRQEGAFENLSDEDLEDLGVGSNRPIQIRPLAMTFMAVQGEISMMTQLSSAFESQKAYESVFRATYLNSAAARIVLAYKIGLLMGSATGALREGLPQKFDGAVSRAKNLSWALLHQAVRNNSKYQQWVDEYGSSLTKDAAFREIVTGQVRNRVAPLMKKLLNVQGYQAKIQAGKFDFLRTNEAFKRAMDFAGDDYGWSKQAF